MTLVLAGCATLPRLVAPEIVSAEVRVVDVRLPVIRIDVELALRNPNPSPVAIASLDADLEIAGERAGTARLAGPVTLESASVSRVLVQTIGDASVALVVLARSLGSARPIDYALRGTVVLADGTAFPFVRRGEVRSGGARP
ncbi:MAG: LEA type 2 family protein [Betaproteobacteria bacterium]